MTRELAVSLGLMDKEGFPVSSDTPQISDEVINTNPHFKIMIAA
ncbi:MAG: hypothetical protein V4594_21030 [Bacteroidota bacterium]